MSGELQTIPARHGVATFVPRGRTIKVINTYGKQVVSMWAFTLGAPPEEGDDEASVGDIEKGAQEAKKAAEEEAKGEKESSSPTKEDESPQEQTSETETADKDKETPPSQDDAADDPPEQAPDTPDSEKPAEATAKQPSKRTWASYLPSIPYRSKGSANKSDAEQKPDAETEKAQNEANTKKWSSYLPTGKGISNYVPNMQVPDTKDVVSAFKSSHYRDPNKSYAEQLYDFSKTPVGAGTIAAATGSGYASSVYAAYTAYATTHPSRSTQAPMEYLSLPHTRASSHKLVPSVDDTLLTNLRNPIVTLVEDTTPGAHDTLTAACDANLYAALGVDKPAEHGSCAENLVLALKELNEEAGLKGAKAIGADISVNIAPTPLHLFMVAPIELDSAQSEAAGVGAKGATLRVDEPMGKKRSFVRFKAERDIVLVFSACPMDVGSQNGGRCMAANFMVEDAEQEKEKEKKEEGSSKTAGKQAPKKLGKKDTDMDEKTADQQGDVGKQDEAKTGSDAGSEDAEASPANKTEDKADDAPADSDAGSEEAASAPESKTENKTDDAPAGSDADSEEAASAPASKTENKADDAKPDGAADEAAKPKKKPKKLEVRRKPVEGSS